MNLDHEYRALQASPPSSDTVLVQRETPHPWHEAYPVTMGIIGVNVAIFLAVEATGGTGTQNLLRWGADFGPLTLSGQWWRMLASTFLHGGLLHIGFNMLALWSLGPLVEKILGRAPFLLAYLACGLGGSLLSLWWHPMIVSIGASGAIFGIAGVLMAVLYLKHLPIPKDYLKKNLGSVGAFIAYNLIFGAVVKMVDNAAHVGGLVTGAVIGAALVPVFDREASLLRRYVAFPVFAAVLVAGASAAARGNQGLAEFATGSNLVDQHKYEAAIPHLEKAVATEPDNADAQFQLAFAYLNLGRVREAEPPMAAAVRLRPDDYAAQYDLGIIYFNLNRPSDAIPHLQAAVQKHPSADAWYYIGMSYMQTGHFDQALPAFRQCLQLQPHGDKAESAQRAIDLMESKAGNPQPK